MFREARIQGLGVGWPHLWIRRALLAIPIGGSSTKGRLLEDPGEGTASVSNVGEGLVDPCLTGL